jgi:RNA polymerase sigma factor (sigma-70 family)
MTEYHPLTMVPLEELKGMKDISGVTLYNAEAKRVPPLTAQEQNRLLAEAQQGSIQARNRLIMSCLALTISFAKHRMWERKLQHSDLADLIGVANVSLLEKFPKALEQEEPLRYLLKEVLYDLKKYGLYDDPLIQRPRQLKLDPTHPETISFEADQRNVTNRVAAAEKQPSPEEPINQPLHEAIHQLTPVRKTVIVSMYGLYGNPQETAKEIAKSRGVTDKSVYLAAFSARKELAKKLPSRSKQ